LFHLLGRRKDCVSSSHDSFHQALKGEPRQHHFFRDPGVGPFRNHRHCMSRVVVLGRKRKSYQSRTRKNAKRNHTGQLLLTAMEWVLGFIFESERCCPDSSAATR
jgi:hypothetical protein